MSKSPLDPVPLPMTTPVTTPVATPPHEGGASGTGERADVTGLLLAWGEGDRNALDTLFPIVYAELRRQARRAHARTRSRVKRAWLRRELAR